MATLAQSTAYTRMFMMIDSSDHVTGKTGLTVTVTLSKAGAAFGALGGSVTEVSSGWYKISLNTTDTNTLGDLAYHCTATGADPTDFVDQVNLAGLDANVTYINGSLTTGNNATLKLKSLDITNSAGSAIIATSSGSNGHGVILTGNGSGHGLKATGGGTGNGFDLHGGGTSGNGLYVTSDASSQAAFFAGGTNSHGIFAGGNGTGYGIYAQGGTGASAHGIYTTGGSTSGSGLATVGTGGQNDISSVIISAIKAKTDNLPEAIQKNQALNNFMFLMVKSSNHIDPKTGLSPVVQRSIDGGAFANCTNSPATEVSDGWYKINLSAADLNGTVIAIRATGTAADDRNILIKTAV